jgi:carbon-monoxide dehydrogenase large subunit
MSTGGASALLAARQVRAKVLRLASHLLEADLDDLELADGAVTVRGNPTRRLGFAQLAAQATLAHNLPPDMTPGLDATVAFDPPQTVYAYATNACEVEVDPATGAVRLLQYVAVDDSGTLVNPMIVDGQLHGGIAQSIGGALLEELRYDEHGQLLTASLMDYLAPTACEVPWIEVAHQESPSPHIPGGFKGAGEAGTVAVPAAIANAVQDALRPTGAAANALPLTPERVLALAQHTPSRRPPAP